ncbi:MAG: hypothetical protein R3D67_07600 [Hyphomicrobiaceae bacterium]
MVDEREEFREPSALSVRNAHIVRVLDLLDDGWWSQNIEGIALVRDKHDDVAPGSQNAFDGLEMCYEIRHMLDHMR